MNPGRQILPPGRKGAAIGPPTLARNYHNQLKYNDIIFQARLARSLLNS